MAKVAFKLIQEANFYEEVKSKLVPIIYLTRKFILRKHILVNVNEFGVDVEETYFDKNFSRCLQTFSAQVDFGTIPS